MRAVMIARDDSMSESIDRLYQQRICDIKTTCNQREPSRVPIMGNVSTWPVGYAGAKTRDLVFDRRLQTEVMCKYLDDVYIDCIMKLGLGPALKTVWALESSSWGISPNEVTIQHAGGNCPMEPQEYPALIADPMGFMLNGLGPRKFPALRRPYPHNLEALKQAAFVMMDSAADYAANGQCAKERYGIPAIIGAKLYAPLDLIADRLRGVTGMLTDMHRHPQALADACEALYPIYMKAAEKGITGDFPFACTTAHVPTFLGPKKFAQFFWPTYRRMLLRVRELGCQTLLFMEGTWEPYFDLLNELPPNTLIGLLEMDDPVEAKKRIGKNITIMGGVSTELLALGTKQECLDRAKQILDACAPGGGFLWAEGRSLLALGDAKPENLIAVNEFVHEYGKY